MASECVTWTSCSVLSANSSSPAALLFSTSVSSSLFGPSGSPLNSVANRLPLYSYNITSLQTTSPVINA